MSMMARETFPLSITGDEQPRDHGTPYGIKNGGIVHISKVGEDVVAWLGASFVGRSSSQQPRSACKPLLCPYSRS